MGLTKMGTHFIYVALCKDNTLYTGYTTNVEKRITVHNNGTGAKYTKTRRPITLLYAKEYATKSEALKAEYAFKQQTRIQKINYLIGQGVKIRKTSKPIIQLLQQEELT